MKNIEGQPGGQGKEKEKAGETVQTVEEEWKEGSPWYQYILEYLELGKFPPGITPADKKALKRLAVRFVVIGGTLYRRSFEGLLLRCLDDDESRYVIKEAHSGVCGGHVNAQMLCKKIIR